MALYTTLDAEAFNRLAEAYGLGTVREFTGIPQGYINSNYRLVTASGRYFVRHTTVRSGEVLRFEAELLSLLNESHCPAPRLLSTREGVPFLEMAGGRVSVFAWLPGEEGAEAIVDTLFGEAGELAVQRVELARGGHDARARGARAGLSRSSPADPA